MAAGAARRAIAASLSTSSLLPGLGAGAAAAPVAAWISTAAATAAAAPAAKPAAAPAAAAGKAKPAPAAAAAATPSPATPSPKGGKKGGATGERVYDYKVGVPPHQTVYTPALGAGGAAAAKPAGSTRTGMLLLKAGMCGEYDKWGVRRALSVLALEDVLVTGGAAEGGRGYTAVQVGAAHPKPSRLTKPLAGSFAAAGVAPRRHLGEFRVTPDAVLPVGTALDVRHWVPGQYVNVAGVTQGKGFQGGMKRHGFAGQKASHGNSVSHRALGSTGCRQDPGKVMKGKKMPGHMGATRVTVEGLRVYKIDLKRGLVYVEGAVPGKAGTLLRVTDAPKKPSPVPLPFPTYTPTAADLAARAKWAAGAFQSPADAAAAALAAAAGVPPPPPTSPTDREPPYEWVVAPPEADPFRVREDEEGEEV